MCMFSVLKRLRSCWRKEQTRSPACLMGSNIAIYASVGSICANETFATAASTVGCSWFYSYPSVEVGNRKHSWYESLSYHLKFRKSQPKLFFETHKEFSRRVDDLRLRFTWATDAALRLLSSRLRKIEVSRSIRDRASLNGSLPRQITTQGYGIVIEKIRTLLENGSSELGWEGLKACVMTSRLLIDED